MTITITLAPARYIVATRTFRLAGYGPPPDWQSTRAEYTLDQARADYNAGRVEIATGGRSVVDGVLTEHIYAIPRRVQAPPRRWFGHSDGDPRWARRKAAAA